MRSLSAWLMSERARASSPISSRRAGSRGTTTSRARPSLTRCAARASRRRGSTIVRARNSDSSTDTKCDDRDQNTELEAFGANRMRDVTRIVRHQEDGAGACRSASPQRGRGYDRAHSGVRVTGSLRASAARDPPQAMRRGRPRPGSMNGGGRRALVTVSITRSRKRAASFSHGSSLGITQRCRSEFAPRQLSAASAAVGGVDAQPGIVDHAEPVEQRVARLRRGLGERRRP